VLDRTAPFDAAERVYRVTLNPDRYRQLQRIREEIGEGPQLTEALDFLNEPSVVDFPSLSDLLRAPFTRRPFPKDRRFSNGDYGVLYTAREEETAGQEYAYWVPRNFNPAPERPLRVRLHLISIWFEGRAKDVRQFLDVRPWLISDDYSECQRLGAAARALAGLIAPSARRRPDGATVPIFRPDAASEPVAEGEVVFMISATGPTLFEISR
jgi:RES domain